MLQEQQEALQHTSDFKTPAIVEKAADETQIPKADKMAIKKSILTDKPAKLEVEVLNPYNEFYLKIIFIHINFIKFSLTNSVYKHILH